MTEARIIILAPAIDTQLKPIIGGIRMKVYRKGDFIEWGRLHVRHLLTGEGTWHFNSTYIIQKDDFWGKLGAFRSDGRAGGASTWDESAYGTCINQMSMNLLAYSEKPKQRLAMTLYGFTTNHIQVGSRGNGTLIRGNTQSYVSPNLVVGPNGQYVTEATDGKIVNIQWVVNEIADRAGFNSGQRRLTDPEREPLARVEHSPPDDIPQSVNEGRRRF
jgi:hypothetical protein